MACAVVRLSSGVHPTGNVSFPVGSLSSHTPALAGRRPPFWSFSFFPPGFCSPSLCNFLRSDIVIFLDFCFMEGFSQRQNSAVEEGLKKMVIFRPGGALAQECLRIARILPSFSEFSGLSFLSLCGLFRGVVKAALVWGGGNGSGNQHARLCKQAAFWRFLGGHNSRATIGGSWNLGRVQR